MFLAFQTVLPIFAFVAVGWGLAVTGALEARVGEGLAVFAGSVGIPVLLFRTIVDADLGSTSPWLLWACYFPAAGLSWALGHVLTRTLFGRDARTAVIGGMGSAFANTAFVGLPLAHQVYGEHGALIVTLLISVHMPIMMTAATLMMTRAEGGEAARPTVAGVVARIGRALVHNPIVLGVVAGGLARIAGLRLAGIPGDTVRTLADVAGPVSLVALGMAIHGNGLRGDVVPTLVVSAVKLLVMPALVLVACDLAHLDAATTGPLVVLAGVPSGINVFLIATQFGVGQRLGSSVVAMTTALGVLTSTGWLALLRAH